MQLKAKPTDRGLVLTLGDVLFDTGKADLNSGGSRNLDKLVKFLTDHPERRVEIDGFTDSVGTDSFNLDLSQRRADTVKSALVNRGDRLIAHRNPRVREGFRHREQRGRRRPAAQPPGGDRHRW